MKYCTFYVDNLYLGIEVTQVVEVIRYQEMTRVPLAPDVVRGMINLRGQILCAIDMRRRLSLDHRTEADRLPDNVVIQTGDGPLSLLVDAVGDVVEVDEGDVEPTPYSLKPAYRELIHGVYKTRDDLMLLLDAGRVV
jgi:purine-binding chemotaxis protein CheW